ncbi:hypothetical protein NLM27_21130 [Bradyrhizobium sp. CCGB12]|uniref:hypothetical protein n=1 Tax=Bradyrhizobium sp. CCGB12 TaxID=2949632 RepID=UPI0020B3700B|nr:hypothetical protein [Bradyrhizobium sp. CCGB12]MCP3391294.1 hypothetical protein [Bradyrhizobium sp. CCGB12]
MKIAVDTKVISRVLEVLFVAGLPLHHLHLLHCNSRSCRGEAGREDDLPRSSETKNPGVCALHAQTLSSSATGLVHVTNQINAATDQNDRRHGP